MNENNNQDKKPENWDSFLELLKHVKVDDDFLSSKERNQDLTSESKDPFKGYRE